MDPGIKKESEERVTCADASLSAAEDLGSKSSQPSDQQSETLNLTKQMSGATPPTQRVLPSLLSSLVTSGGGSLRSAGDAYQAHFPLSPVKRFLCSLIKFGEDISAATGDTVRRLVCRLLTDGLAIPDFQRQLQEVTSFPVRPFVLPFLQSNIPLLRERIEKLANAVGMSPSEFLTKHQSVLQDCDDQESFAEVCPPKSTSPSAGQAASLSPGKRKSSESGDVSAAPTSSPKRPRSLSSLLSPPLFPTLNTRASAGQLIRPQPWTTTTSSSGPKLAAVPGQPQTRQEDERSGEEEWKNVQVMLNCILGMVEKTQRAIRILQQRQTSPTQSNNRSTEEVVADLQTRANLAILEVKRAAVEQIRTARQTSEEACWQCGRPATETCSGCSLARYCGQLCQHKDWEEHHALCAGSPDKRRKKAEKREERKGSSLQGET